MIDIESVLHILASKRRLFHSEADLQHALAWAIHEHQSELSVRLEYPVNIDAKSRIHVDIWLTKGPVECAIELKYATTLLYGMVDGESYDVRDQSANDLTRYGVCKDIQRLESLSDVCGDFSGYVIVVSNYPGFWKLPTSTKPTNDAAFRIHDGATFHGELDWDPKTSPRTRQDPLNIKGTYVIEWKEYSMIENQQNGRFRYAVVRV